MINMWWPDRRKDSVFATNPYVITKIYSHGPSLLLASDYPMDGEEGVDWIIGAHFKDCADLKALAVAKCLRK